MLVGTILFGIFLCGLGLLVKRYPNLLAGYNSLPKEEKERINTERMTSLARNYLVIMGLGVVLMQLLMKTIQSGKYTGYAIFAFTVVLSIACVVHLNRALTTGD